ncbi:MAG: phage protein Gp27 family protein, partial [Hyphomicrobium sp.]
MASAGKAKRNAKRPAAADVAENPAKRWQRPGRGRLCSLDLLPEDATPAVVKALDALRERKLSQAAILRDLNAELEALDLDITPISKSAFNRKALWLASYGKQIENTREIASVFAEKLDQTPEGDVGLLLGETIKTLIFDVLSEASMSQKSPSIVMLGVA